MLEGSEAKVVQRGTELRRLRDHAVNVLLALARSAATRMAVGLGFAVGRRMMDLTAINLTTMASKMGGQWPYGLITSPKHKWLPTRRLSLTWATA